MKFNNVLAAMIQYLPTILQGMVAVEQAIGSGNGAPKKQLIMNAFEAAAHVGETVPNNEVQGVSLLIDLTAQTLNATGLLGFKKSTPAA